MNDRQEFWIKMTIIIAVAIFFIIGIAGAVIVEVMRAGS